MCLLLLAFLLGFCGFGCPEVAGLGNDAFLLPL
jgi:hypothetical protein